MKIIKLILAFSLLFTACNPAVSQDTKKITEFDPEKKANVILIDVRAPGEFAGGHLPNAKNMNVSDEDFKNQFSGFGKKETIYVYCHSGKRSLRAQRILRELGFLKVINLEGGFLAWKRAQKPVEK